MRSSLYPGSCLAGGNQLHCAATLQVTIRCRPRLKSDHVIHHMDVSSGIHALRSAAVAARCITAHSSHARLASSYVPLILRCTWAASLPASFVRFAHSGRMNMTRSFLASMPCSSDWPGPSQARPFHATGGIRRRPSMDRRCLRRSCAVDARGCWKSPTSSDGRGQSIPSFVSFSSVSFG